MPLRGIKLVTFDATNTLLNFRVPPWEYYAMVANDYGFKGNGKDIKPKMLNSFRVMIEQQPNFGCDTICWDQWWRRLIEMTFQDQLLNDSNIGKISAKLIEDYKTERCWRKANGADDLIGALKASGITIGVISNFDPRLHDILHNLKIINWFEFVLTSYEAGVCKPDKKIFEIAKARSKLKLNTSECLHIGDDLKKDYEGAKMAGWHALLLLDKDVDTSLKPPNTYSSLKQINDAIAKNDLQFL